MRRQVLEEETPPTHRGWGRALVIGHGLAAWMKAWPPSAAAVPPGPRTPPPATLPEASVPAFLRPQVTHILVNMILGTRQEVLS